MTDIFEALAAPFHPDKVSWRVGATTGDKKKGMALAYIDARDVLERLDAVVGPANWQSAYPHATNKTCCSIGIRIDGEWVWKANGAGDSDHEAEKGAFSDAFKRAGVCWGIGRYLYDINSPWVEIEPAGKSFRIKQDQYRILRRALTDDAAPAPEPARQQAPKQQPGGTDDPRQKALAFKVKFVAEVRKTRSVDELNAVRSNLEMAKGMQALHDRHNDLWQEAMADFAKHETSLLEGTVAA